MKTKDQLIEICGQYFKGTEIKVIHATADSNFFHDANLNYASAHAQSNNLGDVFTITRADYDNMVNPQEEPTEDQPEDETTEDEPTSEETPQDDPQEEPTEDQPEDETTEDEPTSEETPQDDPQEEPTEDQQGNTELDNLKPKDITVEDGKAFNLAHPKQKAVHKNKVTAAYKQWKKDNS